MKVFTNGRARSPRPARRPLSSFASEPAEVLTHVTPSCLVRLSGKSISERPSSRKASISAGMPIDTRIPKITRLDTSPVVLSSSRMRTILLSRSGHTSWAICCMERVKCPRPPKRSTACFSSLVTLSRVINLWSLSAGTKNLPSTLRTRASLSRYLRPAQLCSLTCSPLKIDVGARQENH